MSMRLRLERGHWGGFSIPDRSGDAFGHARWDAAHRVRLLLAVLAGRHADQLGEPGAERAQGGEADGEAHLGHRERSEEHTSELQSRGHLVCRLLLEKKK